MRAAVLMIVFALAASTVLAGPPQTGVYLSDDMGGQVLTGRFSESWVDPGSHGQLGNTINAQSYDPAFGQGSQWKVWCASIALPSTLVSDTRDVNGTGEVTWRTAYSGGLFWFSADGPWGDGAEDYTGLINMFTATTTYLYVEGEALGIRSNIVTTGQFDNYDDCFEYTINNTAFFGDTDANGPLPSDFPEFMDENCQAGTPTRGGWGSVTEIALRILGNCTVGAEATTWGAVKSLYQE